MVGGWATWTVGGQVGAVIMGERESSTPKFEYNSHLCQAAISWRSWSLRQMANQFVWDFRVWRSGILWFLLNPQAPKLGSEVAGLPPATLPNHFRDC